MPNALQVECVNCKVAGTCPRKGSSPMLLPNSNKRKMFCSIVGGYGRTPVDEKILSPDSLLRMKKDGPCMTMAHIPTWDEEHKRVSYEIVKIFAPAVKHPRETVPHNINMFYPSNPAAGKRPGK